MHVLCSRTAGRREFLAAGAGAAALGWTGISRAQSKPPVLIGWLMVNSRKQDINRYNAFKEGMAALGWKEGVHYVLEERWADGQVDRLSILAQEIAAAKPQIIVAAPTQSAIAAAKAAPTTPIVQANGNPLSTGMVASLARPGGMVTGLTNIAGEISDKLVELMRDAMPGVRRFGCIVDASSATGKTSLARARQAADKLSIELRAVEVSSPREIEPALARLAKENVQALIVLASAFFNNERHRIVKFALAQRWPTFAGQVEFAEAGALATYGADRVALFRRAAYYVDRILKGAKPGELPIEQPTKFELMVNLKTAKALGITVPQVVMVRADRVIE